MLAGFSYVDLVYFKRLHKGFTAQLDKKTGELTLMYIDLHTKEVNPIMFVESIGYYNLRPGKQLRKCSVGEHLGYTTKANQITIYKGLMYPMITETSNIRVQLEKIEDFIIDFKFMMQNTVVVVTDSGFISTYGFKSQTYGGSPGEMSISYVGQRVSNFQFIQRLKIQLEEGETVTSLDTTPSNNFVLVATNVNNISGKLHFFNVMLKKSAFDNLDYIPMLDYTEIREFVATEDISASIKPKLDSEYFILGFDLGNQENGYNIFYRYDEEFRFKTLGPLGLKNQPKKFYSDDGIAFGVDSEGNVVGLRSKLRGEAEGY